jgi:hypothetical protein
LSEGPFYFSFVVCHISFVIEEWRVRVIKPIIITLGLCASVGAIAFLLQGHLVLYMLLLGFSFYIAAPALL